MWIVLSDAFFSIVKKDCGKDELLVRARRKGDIERVFGKRKVVRVTEADYLYRAVVKTSVVQKVMAHEIAAIGYDNFKDTVKDKELHTACLRVWGAMADMQELPPYSGLAKWDYSRI